jgi:hypothetical protein
VKHLKLPESAGLAALVALWSAPGGGVARSPDVPSELVGGSSCKLIRIDNLFPWIE